MNKDSLGRITVDDFNVICRVCLQINQDMIDIYESGIENELMEVTNLKINFYDELPKTLCQKCHHQVNEFLVFLEQARSSDKYLKSLLTQSKGSCTEEELKTSEEKEMKRKTSCKKKRWKRKLRIPFKFEELEKDQSDSETDKPETDKIYLIYVPDTEGNNEKTGSKICIKDLNVESENFELINYCKTLVNNTLDNTYPVELTELTDQTELREQVELTKQTELTEQTGYPAGAVNEHDTVVYQSDCYLELNSKETDIYAVNMFMYECSECGETFEEASDLTKHFLTHETEPNFLQSDYNCPVCPFSLEEKTNFITHLQTHKEEGYLFIKVNTAGEIVPTNPIEEGLFLDTVMKHKKCCKVFCINLVSVKCSNCYSKIQSKEAILEHLGLCLSNEKSKIKFNLRYICPICYKTFTDDENSFIGHLSSHKEDNCYFIKVKDARDPVELGANDDLFVPFLEAVKFLNKKSSVYKIFDFNLCHKCDQGSDSLSQLVQHCSAAHFKKVSPKLFCCPVCSEEYSGGIPEKDEAEFFKHLRKHKSDGISFVLVKENGDMADSVDKYSDLFTQSTFLWSTSSSCTLLFQNCSAELSVLDLDNSLTKYTCDNCKAGFSRKRNLIKHLKSHEPKESVQCNVNFICEKCGTECSGALSYRKHFSKHSKRFAAISQRPVCGICKKTFANRSTLNNHMKHHLKEGKVVEPVVSVSGIMCEKCGKNFSNNASLAKHKVLHSKEKESKKCEICGRNFLRQSSFDKHRSAHFNPKYFECHVCKIPLSSAKSLKKHSEIHKSGGNTFDCKGCDLSFLTKDSLSVHESHTGHYQNRKPLECNVCHEKFFIMRKFLKHIKTHPKYKMGQCTLCGKRLSTIQSLMNHMGRHFESNGILCPHCGRQFFEERNYHRHLMTHEGVKPYRCDMEGCEKSFYTLFELNRHKKYHNNTRDFSCPYCSKRFHEANHLTVHIRTHTGERPYICPHCNKGFVTRTHCRNHIKLIHKGVGYDLIKSHISKKVTVFEPTETTV